MAISTTPLHRNDCHFQSQFHSTTTTATSTSSNPTKTSMAYSYRSDSSSVPFFSFRYMGSFGTICLVYHHFERICCGTTLSSGFLLPVRTAASTWLLPMVDGCAHISLASLSDAGLHLSLLQQPVPRALTTSSPVFLFSTIIFAFVVSLWADAVLTLSLKRQYCSAGASF